MSATAIDEPFVKAVPEAEDDLDALAAQQAATWPALSDERKRELGHILSAAA